MMAISEAQGGASPVDVAEFIDQQPVGGFQIRLLLTCAAVLFLDGFDTQAIGYVAPALAKEWGLTKGALGPVFSAGLFGLMIGALVFGPLADRIGRKKIIIFSTLAFGIGALVTAFVQDVNTLLAIRFLTGLGLGGAMPNAIAMTSEFNPRRRRATMVMIMFCRVLDRRSPRRPAGGGDDPGIRLALGIHRRRRRAAAAGADPGAAAAGIRAVSGADRARANARVAQLLALINPKAVFAPGTQFVVHEPGLAGIPVLHLFRDGRTAGHAAAVGGVLHEPARSLFPVELAAHGSQRSRRLGFGGGGDRIDAAGRRRGRRVCARQHHRPLLVSRADAGVFHRRVRGRRDRPAWATPSSLVTMAIFVAGFCIVGGQTAANALAAGYYPTSVRSTGVGWALGIGRVGSIVGPLVGGVLLTMKWSTAEVFMCAAVAALCAALASFCLSRLAGMAETA